VLPVGTFSSASICVNLRFGFYGTTEKNVAVNQHIRFSLVETALGLRVDGEERPKSGWRLIDTWRGSW
jgi:hypothetical protein